MTIAIENEIVTASDGKENKVISYDMPRASTAIYSDSDGSIMIESNTTFSGYYGMEDMTAK
jgi:long-subunit acyl-CoA synthetase (AMP-forming)